MLLEREAQSAVMADAVAGDGGLLVVRGEAGAGSSALLRRLGRIAADRGARVLRAGAAPAERDFPFGVVRQLVLPLLDDSALPPILRSLAGPVPEDTAPLLYGLQVLLASLAEAGPVAVLVDDLRWADEPSLRALAFLAGRTRALFGVVVQDGPRPALVHEFTADWEVRAEPLSAAGTRTFVGTTAAPEFAAACYELTGGRPKELAELCSRAFADRLTGTAEDCERLRALGAAARRERLRFLVRREPAVEAFARAVVVLGRHAEPALVARLSGLDATACAEARALLGDTWLTTAVDGRLIPEPALVRVVEEAMTTAETAAAHRSAAALLTAQGFPPEQVAAQLLSVDTLRDREEVETLRAAAVAALRRGAPDLAARYLRRALLDVPPDCAGRARLLTELAAAEPDPRAAVRYLVQAAPLLPAGHDRAAAVARIPLTAAARGPLVTELVRSVAGSVVDDVDLAFRLEAREWFAALDDPVKLAAAPARLAELAGGSTAARLEALLGEPVTARQSGSARLAEVRAGGQLEALLGDARPTAGRAARLEAAHQSSSARLEAFRGDPGTPWPRQLPIQRPSGELRTPGAGERELRAVLLLAATLAGGITADDAVRHARVLLDHEPAGTVRAGTALRIVPLILIAAGRADLVTSWLASAGGPRAGAATRVLVDVHRALALLSRGRFAEAREPAERAFRTAEPGSYDLLALPATTVALVADSARSRELARQVLDGLPAGDDLAVFAVRRGLRGMLAARENPDAALAQFLDRGRLLDRAGWRNPAIYAWRGSAALLAHRLGRTDEARQLAEEHHRHSMAWGAPVIVGRSLRVLAALAERRRAVELLREAVDLLDGAPDALESAKACADLGTHLRTTDPTAARRLLARAQQLAESCGAGRLEAREDGTFANAELPRPAAELTAGEATVARLALGGRTNAEIAQELSISRRAVEKQLTGLYRKLKIDGRAQLADVLGTRSTAD